MNILMIIALTINYFAAVSMFIMIFDIEIDEPRKCSLALLMLILNIATIHSLIGGV